MVFAAMCMWRQAIIMVKQLVCIRIVVFLHVMMSTVQMRLVSLMLFLAILIRHYGINLL